MCTLLCCKSFLKVNKLEMSYKLSNTGLTTSWFRDNVKANNSNSISPATEFRKNSETTEQINNRGRHGGMDRKVTGGHNNDNTINKRFAEQCSSSRSTSLCRTSDCKPPPASRAETREATAVYKRNVATDKMSSTSSPKTKTVVNNIKNFFESNSTVENCSSANVGKQTTSRKLWVPLYEDCLTPTRLGLTGQGQNELNNCIQQDNYKSTSQCDIYSDGGSSESNNDGRQQIIRTVGSTFQTKSNGPNAQMIDNGRKADIRQKAVSPKCAVTPHNTKISGTSPEIKFHSLQQNHNTITMPIMKVSSVNYSSQSALNSNHLTPRWAQTPVDTKLGGDNGFANKSRPNPLLSNDKLFRATRDCDITVTNNTIVVPSCSPAQLQSSPLSHTDKEHENNVGKSKFLPGNISNIRKVSRDTGGSVTSLSTLARDPSSIASRRVPMSPTVRMRNASLLSSRRVMSASLEDLGKALCDSLRHSLILDNNSQSEITSFNSVSYQPISDVTVNGVAGQASKIIDKGQATLYGFNLNKEDTIPERDNAGGSLQLSKNRQTSKNELDSNEIGLTTSITKNHSSNYYNRNYDNIPTDNCLENVQPQLPANPSTLMMRLQSFGSENNF